MEFWRCSPWPHSTLLILIDILDDAQMMNQVHTFSNFFNQGTTNLTLEKCACFPFQCVRVCVIFITAVAN